MFLSQKTLFSLISRCHFKMSKPLSYSQRCIFKCFFHTFFTDPMNLKLFLFWNEALCVGVSVCLCVCVSVSYSISLTLQKGGDLGNQRRQNSFPSFQKPWQHSLSEGIAITAVYLDILGILSLRFRYYIIIEYNFLFNFCNVFTSIMSSRIFNNFILSC